jgi:hypothetical protein
MQNAADAQAFTRKELLGALGSKIAYADDPFRLKNVHDLAQMFVARGEQRGAFRCRQFIWGAIPAAALHKSEWAIIHHNVLLKKFFSGTESLGEKSPQPLTTDLAALTRESDYESLRVLTCRTTDLGLDPEPIADGGDLTERDAGLDHAERARIHPEKDHPFRCVGITAQVSFVCRPGIIEWVVNVRDGWSEVELAYGGAKTQGGLD